MCATMDDDWHGGMYRSRTRKVAINSTPSTVAPSRATTPRRQGEGAASTASSSQLRTDALMSPMPESPDNSQSRIPWANTTEAEPESARGRHRSSERSVESRARTRDTTFDSHVSMSSSDSEGQARSTCDDPRALSEGTATDQALSEGLAEERARMLHERHAATRNKAAPPKVKKWDSKTKMNEKGNLGFASFNFGTQGKKHFPRATLRSVNAWMPCIYHCRLRGVRKYSRLTLRGQCV